MGKRIDSPVKRYPGYVILPDYYGFGELMTWDDQFKRAEESEGVNVLKMSNAILPMVEEWHIAGLPEKPDRMPGTPRADGLELVTWLLRSISDVINGDEAIDPLPGGASTNG